MAEFLSPGVYVIEEPSGLKPIEGVSTSTGAFVGIAAEGAVDTPKLITSFTKFQSEFGGYVEGSFLATAVYQFFKEGGARCYVVRTVQHNSDGSPQSNAAESMTLTNFGNAVFQAASHGSWAVTGLTGGKYDKGVQIEIAPASEGNPGTYFKIIVYCGKDPKKVQINKMISDENKKVDERAAVEVMDMVTLASLPATLEKSKYIQLKTAPDPGFSLPANGLSLTINLDQANTGLDGLNASAPFVTSADLIGSEDHGTGLHAFDTIDGVNIIAIPDATLAGGEAVVQDIMREGMIYCESRSDCFFVADAVAGLDVEGIKAFKTAAMLNSSFGALYYPWIKTANPFTGLTGYVPPSGAVAGIIANTDINIGVHKAPAGHGTGKLLSASGVEFIVTKGEHDILNPEGINVIRPFPNAGLIVYGARTVSADSEWRYINVRRLFLFVEESIDEASQWVVFEPNSPSLWGTVKRNIVNFLTTVWRSGALFGTTEEEAFYVKVDAENNPPAERDLGRLNIEIGIAPVKPAEFVIIRISQKTLTA